ncbi:MAG: tetraacyldisaccharide 4'-kinase [Acidobacteriota bacterium]
MKNLLYDTGVVRPRRLARPVVSIGNLALGGTGKTPVGLYLFERLSDAGWKPSVLMRGYSTGRLSDEAILYRMKLPAGAVYVGADRWTSGRQAEADGRDIHILDDGYQHRQLHRDSDVLLIDCSNPWGSGMWLREGVESIRRATIVLLTRFDAASPLDSGLARALPANVPTFRARFVPTVDLGGRAVFAFCGIGNPGAFLRTVEQANGRLAGHNSFNDHHEYTEGDLAAIRETAERCGAQEIYTTEKDLVRISAETASRLGIHALPIRTEVEEGFVQAVVEQIGGRR